MRKYLIIILCLTATVCGINKRYIRPQANTVGLIAHYKLWDGLMTTGKVFDYSLNGHVGTLQDTDTPITLVPTFPGFDFDGSNDYIEIADHDNFSFGDGSTGTPFSFSAWCFMHDASKFTIVSKGAYNVDAEFRLVTWTDDKIYFNSYDESVDNCYIGRMHNTALTNYENQWIHIAATSDGGTLSSGSKIYLNSVRIDDTDSKNGTFVAIEELTHAVWIGRYSVSYADGLISDVNIYDKELSAIEVKNIYEVTRWRYQR